VWPTFNVADSTITVGVALLLIEGFMAPKAERSHAAHGDAASNTSAAKT
jgi:lipoprotein signal peptidase